MLRESRQTTAHERRRRFTSSRAHPSSRCSDEAARPMSITRAICCAAARVTPRRLGPGRIAPARPTRRTDTGARVRFAGGNDVTLVRARAKRRTRARELAAPRCCDRGRKTARTASRRCGRDVNRACGVRRQRRSASPDDQEHISMDPSRRRAPSPRPADVARSRGARTQRAGAADCAANVRSSDWRPHALSGSTCQRAVRRSATSWARSVRHRSCRFSPAPPTSRAKRVRAPRRRGLRSMYERAFANVQRRALRDAGRARRGPRSSVDQYAVPGLGLGQQLRTVARMLAIRDQFAMQRQIFFVATGGFDSHDEQARGSRDCSAT